MTSNLPTEDFRKQVGATIFKMLFLSFLLINRSFCSIDHLHNDVNSFERLPETSLASISCGSKSQKFE